MVARMSLVTAQTFALFVSGSTEPSSNVGPWLKSGTEWYVWSPTAGNYVPITVPIESLGYVIGDTPPDPTVTYFWIQTDGSGSPLALKIYFSGAWTDVYATKFAGYSTTTEMNTAIAAALAAYSTTADMNTAIAAGDAATLAASEAYTDAAIAGIPPQTPFAVYPAQGIAATQTIAINGAPHQVTFGSAAINPAPAPFNIGTNRYTAPATGIYNVSVSTQFDNDTGTPAGMQVSVSLYKNGSFIGNSMADLDNTPSPTGRTQFHGLFGGFCRNRGRRGYRKYHPHRGADQRESSQRIKYT
jgi:hypothetical protein